MASLPAPAAWPREQLSGTGNLSDHPIAPPAWHEVCTILYQSYTLPTAQTPCRTHKLCPRLGTWRSPQQLARGCSA